MSSKYEKVKRTSNNRYKKSNKVRNRVLIIFVAVLLVAGISFLLYNLFYDKGDNKSPGVTSQASEVAESVLSQVSEEHESDVSYVGVKDDPNITGYMDKNNVFIYDKAGFDFFYGNKDSAAKYIKTVTDFRNALPSNIAMYNMVVPTHVEFGLPPKYQSKSLSQKDNINTIISSLPSGVKPVNVYNTLSQKRDEYIFFNTDHHWTALGAYYAYKEFANVAGFTPLDINKLEKNTKDGFTGAFYVLTKNKTLEQNPDRVDYYTIPGDYSCDLYTSGATEPTKVGLYSASSSGTNAYSVFVYGDNPLMVIRGGAKNGKKLAVVKESYGNAFSPFLAPHYEEVHLLDSRKFKSNIIKYIKDNGITDVLIINNASAANTGARVKELSNLITK